MSKHPTGPATAELLTAVRNFADRFEAWDRCQNGDADAVPAEMRSTTREDVIAAMYEARAVAVKAGLG